MTAHHELTGWLPPDDPQRRALHDEVHARPPALVAMPALVTYVAVLNGGVARQAEFEHLCRLPGQQALTPDDLERNFLRLTLEGCTLKWERHSEFTRYSLVQPLPPEAGLGARQPDLSAALAIEAAWLRAIPGRTVAAVQLVIVTGVPGDAAQVLSLGRDWLDAESGVIASRMGGGREGTGHAGDGHSCAITDFALRRDGFERWLVVTAPDTTPSRAGRIAQRLLELETYRLMALRGLPVAKSLAPMLADAEAALAGITARLEGTQASEQELLAELIALAARVESATAEHMYRFSATRAYDALVRERIAELREKAVPGTQTIGEFMQRRLAPAIATVAATAQRLASLSERVERAGALLRTRVDIATETQNQQLLAKLTRGQELQLRLQTTVEGLSIAAISYYVISLLLYAAKAAKLAGMAINPELAVGALIPLVLWFVWRTTRRIHRRLQGSD